MKYGTLIQLKTFVGHPSEIEEEFNKFINDKKGQIFIVKTEALMASDTTASGTTRIPKNVLYLWYDFVNSVYEKEFGEGEKKK